MATDSSITNEPKDSLNNEKYLNDMTLARRRVTLQNIQRFKTLTSDINQALGKTEQKLDAEMYNSQ